MDSLRAIHGDDEGDRVNVPSDSAPPPAAGVDGVAVDESPGSVIAASGSDDKTGSDQADGIKEEVETPASVDLPSSDGIEAENNDQLVPPNCPNLGADTDGNEEGEEEEEPPAKRQKQAEIKITPPRDNGKQPAAKAGKKSKKKSKDVWMSTSRKGKKKTKHASNSNFKSKNANEGETSTGPKLLIAPLARFPDRNDDSAEMKICLSKVYKAEKVELSEDRLTASSIKGYRMVRATRGVTTGAWYFEIKVMFLGESGHTRLGWSTEKGDLQAPVGYDGNSYGYRDIDGSKVHKALREVYGKEGYKEGDIIGFYINLPDGDSYAPKPPRLVWHKGQRYVTAPDPKEDPPKIVPGSEVSYFKNGVCQGVAFTDLYGGRYYPAASMYTLPNQPPCVVQFNFGPDFECFPEDFGERPAPKAMVEVPYQSYDTAVENGNPWNITRMCPMLKVIKEENCKIVNSAKMVG